MGALCSKALKKDPLLVHLFKITGRISDTGARRWHVAKLMFKLKMFLVWLYAKSQHNEAHFDPETGEAVMEGRGAQNARRKFEEYEAFGY